MMKLVGLNDVTCEVGYRI